MITEPEFLNSIKTSEQKLYRFALRMLRDQGLAQDAVQDLVVKLWRKREMLPPLEKMEVFLMVAMKNHCYDEIKKNTRRRNHYENHSFTHVLVNDNLALSVEKKDLFTHVQKVIAQLPKMQQMVVHLRDVEQMEMDEIANITGLQKGAIRANLSRGRKAIREYIKKLNSYGLE